LTICFIFLYMYCFYYVKYDYIIIIVRERHVPAKHDNSIMFTARYSDYDLHVKIILYYTIYCA